MAALLLSPVLFGADVVLGPEVPLLRDFPNQPIGGDAVALAANGNDFLVVWQDSRGGTPAIRATRVDSTGHAANPLGYLIGAGTNPQVVRAGAGYVVVWVGATHVMWASVDANGIPGTPLPTMAPGPDAMLTTGASTLVIGGGGYNIALLGPNGLADNLPFAGGAFMGAAVHGGSYVLAERESPDGNVVIDTIGDDGSTSKRSLPIAAPGGSRASFGDRSILIVTSSSYAVVGYDGTIIKPLTPISTPPRQLAAAWDGHEFLAVFDQKAFRIAADGTLIDAAPFPLSANAVRQFAFTMGGASDLVAWTDGIAGAALVGRAIATFDSLAAASPAPANLALAPPPQIDAQIALAGAAMCGVWSDPNRTEVHASFDGASLTTIDSATTAADFVGWPAVAAGRSGYLVLWRHLVVGGDDRVLARRFDFSGRALDAAPIVIDTAPDPGYSPLNPPFPDTPPAVGFADSSFLVAWERQPNLATPAPTAFSVVRIDEAGQLHDRRDVPTAGFGYNDDVERVFWTGAGFAVFHVIEAAANIPEAYPFWIAELVRFDAANNPISKNGPQASPRNAGATLSPDGITYAGLDSSSNSIVVGQTRLDGSPLQPTRTVVTRSFADGPSYTDIAWDGSHYVLVWLDAFAPDDPARTLRALRLDRNLAPIDSAPFDVFSGPGPLSAPRLVRTIGGVLIAYSRINSDADGSARAFTRSVQAVPPPPVSNARRRVTH